MQMTDDGEYTSEKELDKNFRIPKKKTTENTDLDTMPTVNPFGPQSEVLANSYYNYYTNSTMNPYYNIQNRFLPAPSQSKGLPDIDQHNLTTAIFDTLKERKEKPKVYDPKHIMKETIPDIQDPSLPKELTNQFQPLFCKLCAVQLTSNIMAKLHYKSKNHEKKVRKFLIDYAEQTGEPLHKRAKIENIPKAKRKEEDNDPRYFHCDVCDLPLTGKLHAESHYMGKNHQKAVLGHKTPAGKGYYNSDGKWIRLKVTKVEFKEGEDSFGLDFKKNPDIPTAVQPQPVAAPEAAPPTKTAPFSCTICNVVAPCAQQIEMHYKGQKHIKKLKQLGMANNMNNINETVKSILPPNITQSPHNFSPNRTPSGQYYCQACNTSLNSESHFRQHLQSKNHLKKSLQVDKPSK